MVAATATELLELDRRRSTQIARTHPRVRDVLENFYIQRASSPEAAAVRAVPSTPPRTSARSRCWRPTSARTAGTRACGCGWRTCCKAGKDDDAVPILVGLADDLARAGYPEKAIAILKKIEKLQRRGIEEVNLAPLRAKRRAGPAAEPGRGAARPATAGGGRQARGHASEFSSMAVDVLRDTVVRDAGRAAAAGGRCPRLARLRHRGSWRARSSRTSVRTSCSP